MTKPQESHSLVDTPCITLFLKSEKDLQLWRDIPFMTVTLYDKRDFEDAVKVPNQLT